MITTIILAAGKGSRLNLGYNKTMSFLDHKMMYEYSLEKFKNLGVDKIILVVSKDYLNLIIKKVSEKNIIVIEGGATRQESVRLALSYVDTKYVIIHDAARPYVFFEDLVNFKNQLLKGSALIMADKVTDTMKIILDDKITTVPRTNLIKSLTPQGFLTEEIKKAHKLGINDCASDDAYLYEKYISQKINYMFVTKNNLKITTPLDINNNYKIGHSFDIHRLVEHKELFLGGIKIPSSLGLLAHSDGDALLHSICEAMLGVIGKQDLGDLFPDNDDKYKNIDSKIILKSVFSLFKEKYEIANIDCMLYLEKPKLKDYKLKMKETISKILEINLEQISIKATTLEKFLLPIGESISAETFILAKIK